MRVRLTALSRLDLLEIGEWIERDNPARAASFVEELYEICMRLGDMPRAFPLLAGKPESGIRKRTYGNYLIFYTVDEQVNVLHVVHGARDYESILFPE